MSEAAPPSTETTEPLKLVLVDQSRDAHDAARDRADTRLSEELEQGGRFKRFVNGIWKGNIAREFYRQSYTRQARESIEESQNVLMHEQGLTQAERTRAMESTFERFSSEYDEVIHEDAGERREVHEQDTEVSTGFKQLLRRYASGELNDVTLREEQTRFMQAYRETHGEDAFGEGLVTTSNMMQVAQAVRGAVEHGESLDHVLANMQVVTGEARNNARTEARYNMVDKAIDKISKTRLGSLLGPEAVTAIATTAATVAGWGSRSVTGAVLKTVAPGVGAGVWAGIRENKRVKDERGQHSREMAQGKEFRPGDARREQMEQTRYESRSAQDLTDFIRAAGNPETMDQGNDAVRAALDALAQVQSRIDLSNRENIDLISYSNAAAIGDERMGLDLARAEVRVALESRLNEDARRELGLDPDASVAELVDEQSTTYLELLNEDISAKDKAFKILKARRVAKAAAVGVATGLAGGLIVQEGIAALDPARAGLFEQAWGAHNEISADGLQHQTLLEGFVEGDDRIIHTDASNTFDSYTTAESGNGQILLSNDHELIENGDGTVNFVDGNGHATVENLAINEDGSFPDTSIDQLEAVGMAVEDHSFDQDVTVTTTEVVDAHGFVENHMAEATTVQRDLWYGNDTPGVYDQNELRVYRGGAAEAPGIIPGGFQYTTAGMHPDGSWQGGEQVDWNQAAASGNLFFAVSATVDTQEHVFMIPIGPDGAINIPEDSPAGHFFSNENNEVVFHGQYGEVVQTTSVDTDGTVHIRPLATMVGDGEAGPITDTVTTTVTEHHAMYTVTTDGYNTTVENFTEAAPVIPIDSRRSLESVRSRRRGYYYGESEYLTPREIEQRRRETSPRLLDDPEARLNPKQELDWYRGKLADVAGREYVNEINEAIASSPELQAPNPELKAMVVIPVSAVGEPENIYKTLSMYGQQDPDTQSQTKILLHVNWVDSAESDPVKSAAIARTRAEIARAQADFPGLSIATIQTVWSQTRLDSGGYGNGLIGHVTRKLYDTAMLSVQDQMRRGIIPSDRDVLMIRNDADAQGMDRRYLQRMIQTAEEHPENDVFTGAIRWDTDRHKDLPGFAFVANFKEVIQIASHRSGSEGAPQTVGINAAVKMAAFAAVGGAGHDPRDTGAGSDDLTIGGRVGDARRGSYGTSRRYARRRQRRTSYTSAGDSSTPHKFHRLVSGAGIDSKGDRLEAAYLNDDIGDTWSRFDAGGYSDRASGLAGVGVHNESLHNDDKGVVIERIEKNISSMLRRWHGNSIDSALVRSALAMMLPIEIDGEPTYRMSRAGGQATFTFSPKGAEWVANRLRRGNNGQFDHIGSRVRRQLYSENTEKRQAVSTQPRFVQ
ncbi:MAG: hypothetical protein WA030_01615 [Candidatus Microsaccharimonas sp.]